MFKVEPMPLNKIQSFNIAINIIDFIDDDVRPNQNK